MPKTMASLLVFDILWPTCQPWQAKQNRWWLWWVKSAANTQSGTSSVLLCLNVSNIRTSIILTMNCQMVVYCIIRLVWVLTAGSLPPCILGSQWPVPQPLPALALLCQAASFSIFSDFYIGAHLSSIVVVIATVFCLVSVMTPATATYWMWNRNCVWQYKILFIFNETFLRGMC